MSESMWLSCPHRQRPVLVNMAGFRCEVDAERCPLSGVPLEPWTRAMGRHDDGSVAEPTTGRCESGCGAEWTQHGESEVAWYGSEVIASFPADPADDVDDSP